MAWNTEMTAMLRYIVNDVSSTPTYSDSRLQHLILTSAVLVRKDANFTNDYTVDLVSFTLDPDPTLTDTREDIFVNLVLLKAACLIAANDLRSSCKHIRFADGKSSMDTTAAAKSYQLIFEKGPCLWYREALKTYQISGVNTVGEAIFTPIRSELFPGFTRF